MIGGRLRDPRRALLLWLRGTDRALADRSPQVIPAYDHRIARGQASYGPGQRRRRWRR